MDRAEERCAYIYQDGDICERKRRSLAHMKYAHAFVAAPSEARAIANDGVEAVQDLLLSNADTSAEKSN